MARCATRTLLLVLPWIAAGVTLLLIARFGDQTTLLRDAMIYKRAVQAVRAGQSPYAAGLELQQLARRGGQEQETWAFVYPPVTLPLIRLAAWMPAWSYESLFWLGYAAGAIAQLWAMLSMLTPAERRVARYVAPACLIFPAFMYCTESVLAGNVVFILYGAILTAAVAGWRRGNWTWFYAAVLVTACVKPQMLTLLLIPVLSSAGQWRAAIATGAGVLSVVAAEIVFWPAAYREWRHALDVQLMSYDREFAHGPVGMLGRALWRRGLPWELPCAIFYLCFASAILIALVYASRRYSTGSATLTDWAPVALIGVVLLNPRLLGNDIFPLTIPMAAIAWRSIQDGTRSWKLTLAASLSIMLAANLSELPDPGIDAPAVRYYPLAITLVVLCFAAGCRRMSREAAHGELCSASA
jgi:hypothetical protein